MKAVPAVLAMLAAVPAAMPLPADAGFAYAPVSSDRSLFIHGPADRLGIAEVAARLAPKGMTLRWDRRVDTSRRARTVHADWKMLLFDFGLAWQRHDDEVHVRPAGLPPGEVELATVGRGVADWSVAQGETLQEALARWSAVVGVELVWLTDRTYRVHETRRFTTALDSHAAVRAQTERDAAEVKAQVARRPSRSACTVTTGAEGLAQARAASRLAGRAAAVSETGRIAGDRATGSAPAAATDSAERYRRILERWCSPDRAPLQSAACSGASEDHGADLRPDSLFGVETFASENELQAAIDLSRNLTVPAVEDPEPLGAVDSASERARIMASRAAAARRALAAEALGHLRALRAPGPELGAWAAAVDPDRDPEAAVSRLELVDLLAAKRFERTAWWTELQSMGGEALLRETASLLAASLLLDRERFRLEERRLAIQAAMLAARIDRDRRVAGRAGAN